MFQHKRTFLSLLALLALLCLAGCGTNTPSASVKTQRISLSSLPIGTGNNPEPGTDNKPHPLLEGHTESILVANGLIYVGSDNGKIYSFDASGGAIRWQSKENATRLFAVDGNMLYIGDSANNIFYALNANSGAVLWQRSMQVEFNKVIVNNGIVYVDTLSGMTPSTIYALRATNGTLLWHYATASERPSLLAVSNGRVYDAPSPHLGDNSGTPATFTALDTTSGHVLWQLTPRTGDGTIGGMAENNDIAYLSTDNGSLYAAQEANGQVLWHASQATSNTYYKPVFETTTPVVMDGTVYTGNTSAVFAYRASDGQLLWQYHPTAINGMPSPFSIQPLVEHGVLFFSASLTMGSLIALRTSDGSVLWQKQAAGAAPGALVLVNGLLIDQLGQLTAWRTSDGSKVWSRNADDSTGPPGPGSSTVIDNSTGILYAGGSNGILQGLHVSDGAQIWTYAIPELPVQQGAIYTATITFTSSTSYDRAIQIVSDLGLKTFTDCHSAWNLEDGKGYFGNDHLFFVAANMNSAPLWLERLQALPEIAQVQGRPEGVAYNCTADIIEPNAIPRLASSQAGSYLKVSFASDTTYLKAWESLNALGFRLANPCYEEARAQDHKPTWQPMGEEGNFTPTHTFVLATTQFNATTWRQQLQTIPGVKQINTLSGSTCS